VVVVVVVVVVVEIEEEMESVYGDISSKCVTGKNPVSVDQQALLKRHSQAVRNRFQ
jgi:hypothetical protein